MPPTLLLAALLAADPPRHVASADAPTHLIAGGKGTATLLLNANNGVSPAALSLLVLAPGAEVPEHSHDQSAEILYVEEGRAEMVVAGQKLTLRPGDAVYVPAGALHAARVTSRHVPLRAVQVYVGPGPEQRFTTGERVERE